MNPLILELFISEVYLCVCGPVRRPTWTQQVGSGAVAGSWALHGRGWRKQTRTWRSFGRNGWSSNRGSAGSGLALHWELPFCAVSPHPLMQRMCLMERQNPNYLHVLRFFFLQYLAPKDAFIILLVLSYRAASQQLARTQCLVPETLPWWIL